MATNTAMHHDEVDNVTKRMEISPSCHQPSSKVYAGGEKAAATAPDIHETSGKMSTGKK